jgi:mannose/fructose/N-acetylgalactosamine-specific phosphotransferase system component IIB
MMDVQLFRIDDRLIHGQVVIGWVKYLKSKRIILCDDDVVQTEWEKELYLSCVPGHLEAIVFNLNEAAAYLLNKLQQNNKTIVLVKSPIVLAKLVDTGYIPKQVNLGGVHFAENRKKVLPYLFLSPSEIECIKSLQNKGICLYCQDIPTSKKYKTSDILKD